MNPPLVTVIINTMNRPIEVVCAVRSVLAQTFRDFEVLVVVDGPNPPTEAALAEYNASLPSPAFQVLVNPVNAGLAESRNIGVRAARGRYVALLDDDDEWLPGKLQEQVIIASHLPGDHHFVACRFNELSNGTEKVWPDQLPNGVTPFSEYLFVQRSKLVPSTFMVSRTLLLDVPFTKGLRHTEDVDWMLRAASDPRTRIQVAPGVCAIYNNHTVAGRESRDFPWYTYYVWSVPHLHLFTPLAYSCFITRGLATHARAAGASKRQLLHLLSAALLLGSFNIKALRSFFISVTFSPEAKARGRRFLNRGRNAFAKPMENGS